MKTKGTALDTNNNQAYILFTNYLEQDLDLVGTEQVMSHDVGTGRRCTTGHVTHDIGAKQDMSSASKHVSIQWFSVNGSETFSD